MEYSICTTNPNIPLVHRLSPWAKITKQSHFFSETSVCGACSEADPRWQKNQNKPKYPHFQSKIKGFMENKPKTKPKIERLVLTKGGFIPTEGGSEIRRNAGGQTQM